MRYLVVLKNIHNDAEMIILSQDSSSRKHAEDARKQWRKVLGGKNWTIERRPGLDTLDHLGLKIIEVK